MATANYTNALTGIAVDGSGRRVGSWTGQLRRAWANKRSYTETLRELRTLSPELLEDLGMDRTPVQSTAHKAVYGA